MSNWIQLASANGYDFDKDEIIGDFDLYRDVVRPATQSRFVKHCDRNWSVAIHSVAVARTIEQVMREHTTYEPSEIAEAAAAGLMHDVAHESVIGDIPTPVARRLGRVVVEDLKMSVHATVLKKLRLPLSLMPNGKWRYYVNNADLAALEVERQLFMAPSPRDWNLPKLAHYWLSTMYFNVKSLLGETDHPQTDGTLDFVAEKIFLTEYQRLVQPFVGSGVDA